MTYLKHLLQPVSVLELSVRTNNCLEEMGIETLDDLVSKHENELLQHERFGQVHLTEVKEQLSYMNLHLIGLDDYITDVSGNRRLEQRTMSCYTHPGTSFSPRQVFVNIKCLGFDGTPSELLRKHGLLYFCNGVNALRLEEGC